MKIVQSYWTKASLKNNNPQATDRNLGGWPDKKYLYFSWALSCLNLYNLYGGVELYTDEKGADLLVEKLELPYSKVHVVLDTLNEYHSDLWALGKLYTYSLQKKPFLHIDGDVFIRKKFEDSFLKGRLMVQNLEPNFDTYKKTFLEIRESFEYIPIVLDDYFTRNSSFESINAGVFGGNDMKFIKQYTQVAFKFVNENIENLRKINIGSFNCIYEQCLFKTMADTKNIEVSCLKESVNDRFDGLVEFTGPLENSWYIHFLGDYKKHSNSCIMMEFYLKKTYPNYYYKIIDLIKRHIV